MNRFVIVDGLPYLLADGKTYTVRWDDEGFTVGAEVKLASVPSKTYPELSILAKCQGNLDSIGDDEQQGQANQNVDDEQQGQANPPETNNESNKEDKPKLEDLKLNELKKYASDNGIALNGARTKKEIIEVINNSSKE